MRKLILFAVLALLFGCSSAPTDAPVDAAAIQRQTNIYPDREWKDINGNTINAHSGGVYYENGFYYWYGSHKLPGSDERRGYTESGVHVYRSRDLINWNDFGLALRIDFDDANSDITFGSKIQRAKVVYNEATDTYVMFFKLYLKGEGYTRTFTGVATAAEPTGPFTYSHKFLASSNKGSGDYALFQQPNGTLYHLAVRRTDRRLVMAKMRPDYKYPATDYTVLPGIQTSTEGLAVFVRDGTYHLFGSGSNGWDPTAPRYYTSSSLRGPWTRRANPLRGWNPISQIGSGRTFGGQASYITKVEGKENQYILMLDVHRPRNPYRSRYIWLPFKVHNQKMVVRWQNSWNLDWF